MQKRRRRLLWRCNNCNNNNSNISICTISSSSSSSNNSSNNNNSNYSIKSSTNARVPTMGERNSHIRITRINISIRRSSFPRQVPAMARSRCRCSLRSNTSARLISCNISSCGHLSSSRSSTSSITPSSNNTLYVRNMRTSSMSPTTLFSLTDTFTAVHSTMATAMQVFLRLPQRQPQRFQRRLMF